MAERWQSVGRRLPFGKQRFTHSVRQSLRRITPFSRSLFLILAAIVSVPHAKGEFTDSRDRVREIYSLDWGREVYSPGRVPGSDSIDLALQDRLENLTRGFRGDVGIYVRHLPTGRVASIRPDTLFPTASMVKVPILLKTFDLIDQGVLAYDSLLVYRDSLLYEGEDILGSFADGEKIALSKVVMLMITTSDNTASLWLQHLVGTGTAVNGWLAGAGFEGTRVNSRTPGRHGDWERYGWGQTTPREMAELLVMVREGRAVSPAASEEMYRVLTRIYWNDEALSQIPPFVQVASKQGMVSRSRSEVALVNAPGGDYVFCIITDNQEDARWAYDNEGYVLIREVSKTLWDYFEPESGWRPAPGMDRYRE